MNDQLQTLEALDRTRDLSGIVGLIYDVAMDAEAWPRLIEALVNHAHVSHCEDVALSLERMLQPHFLRAQQIREALQTAEEERDLVERAINRLPVGIAVVDASLTVLSLNQALLSITRGSRFLRLESGHLHMPSRPGLQQLAQQIFVEKNSQAMLRVGEQDESDAVSLWMVPLGRKHNEMPTKAMVVVASRQQRALSEEGLCKMFQLTVAEAHLVQHLVLGQTLDEATVALGVTKNTAKTHLKRVFHKLGVRRQSELIQAVFGSPLWLGSQGGVDDPANHSIHSSEDGWKPWSVRYYDDGQMTHRVDVGKGRQMAYLDRGDPTGRPVFFVHGLVGSRYVAPPDDHVLMRHGLRLIVPDRAGYGDSSPHPDNTLLSGAQDILAIADHLKLSQFDILGYSVGSSHALALASLQPERVSQLVIVAGMPPFDHILDVRDYYAMFRQSLLMTRYVPTVMGYLSNVFARDVKKSVHRYLSESLAAAPPSDQMAMNDPRLRTNYAVATQGFVADDGALFLREMHLCAHAWGFDLHAVGASLTCPVIFWHGADDQVISLTGARRLASFFPQSKFHEVPGAGHYLVYSHWEEILAGWGVGALV